MEQEVLNYLSDKFPVSTTEEIKELLIEELNNWHTSVHRKLNIENPFFKNQEKYANSIKSFNAKQNDVSGLEADYKGYSSLSEISKCRIDKSFWEKEIHKFKPKSESKEKTNNQDKKHVSTSDLKLTRKLLLQNWDKTLSEEYCKWELSEIEK
jgi:hypothetical protein